MKKLESRTRPIQSRVSALSDGFLRESLHLDSHLNYLTILPLVVLFPCSDVGHQLGRCTAVCVDLTYRFISSFELPSCPVSFLRVSPLISAFQISQIKFSFSFFYNEFFISFIFRAQFSRS